MQREKSPVLAQQGRRWAAWAAMGLLSVVHLSGALAQERTTQLDMSAAFNRDVVWRTTDAAPIEGPYDGFTLCEFDREGRCYVSSMLSIANSSPASAGLPDNGLIPSDGSTFPDVQLAPFNTPGANAWAVNDPNATLSLNLPSPGQYNYAHVFASSGGVNPSTPASVRLRLRYSDGEQVLSNELVVPDWFGDNSPDSYFLLNGLDRTDFGSLAPFRYDAASQSGVADGAIFGLRVPVNNQKLLVGMDIIPVNVPTDGGTVFAIFGALLTTLGGPAPPVLPSTPTPIPTLSHAALLLLALLMAAVLWRRKVIRYGT